MFILNIEFRESGLSSFNRNSLPGSLCIRTLTLALQGEAKEEAAKDPSDQKAHGAHAVIQRLPPLCSATWRDDSRRAGQTQAALQP